MEFTGERFMEGHAGISIDIEHKHRYNFVKQFLKGLTVLDLASGSGYGSNILSESAKQVFSVDIDPEATRFCTEKYKDVKNLEFINGSATDIPLKDNSVDCVVSFETIEHIDFESQQKFLKEIKRVLKKDGKLFMSTPNKLRYSDIPDYNNEYHTKEFYVDDYKKFLQSYFNNVEFLNQDYQVISSIYSDKTKVYIDERNLNADGLYIIGVCSDDDINIEFNNSMITGIHLNNQLVNINANVDLFNTPKGKLFFDNGNGFSEENALTTYYEFIGKDSQVIFDISKIDNIKAFRFDPTEEQFLDVKINEIYLLDSKGKKEIINNYTTNGRNENGCIIFDTCDPNIFFKNNNEVKADKIVINFFAKAKNFLEYIPQFEEIKNTVNGPNSIVKQFEELRTYTTNRENDIVELKQAIEQRNAEINQLKNNFNQIFNVSHYPANPNFKVKEVKTEGTLSIEVVFVTYNSKKWLKGLFDSFEVTDLKDIDISLTFVDNGSSDDTLECLEEYKNKLVDILPVKIIKNDKNLGFGHGCNIGAFASNKQYLFFLNIDTEVFTDTFQKLKIEVLNIENNVGILELRQMPYEHPKYYDPITGETSWASGACFVIKRDIFEKIKGFDEKIFMYAEDVDISFRVRNLGLVIKYLYNCPITHYSYSEENEFKPIQYFNSIFNNIMLRYRYGSKKDIADGIAMVKQLKNVNSQIVEGHNEKIDDFLATVDEKGKAFATEKFPNVNVKFYGFDYEQIKAGAFFVNEHNDIKEGPLVSIIVRTCKRPDTLRETLLSIRNQTYKNFEVIIVEDGENTAQSLIEKEFGDLNITYAYTGKNVGRSKVGNIAMTLSKGEYLNFLDDDDLFYFDHLELLVKEIVKDNTLDFVHSTGLETEIKVHSREPLSYELFDKKVVVNEAFTKTKLIVNNLFPIQCILFNKKFFNKYGGFNTEYDYLEDWDLWLKYFICEDIKSKFIEKTTSVYRVPANKAESEDRIQKLASNYYTIRNKYQEEFFKVNKSKRPDYIEKDVKLCIDELSIQNSKGYKLLNINMWAFCKQKSCTEHNPKISLNLNDYSVVFKLDSIEREDVAEHYGIKNSSIGINYNLALTNTQLKKLKSIDIFYENKTDNVIVHEVTEDILDEMKNNIFGNTEEGAKTPSYEFIIEAGKIKSLKSEFEKQLLEPININTTVDIDKNIKYHIDKFRIEESKVFDAFDIKINCWAYKKDSKADVDAYIGFVLEDNTKIVLPAKKLKREDVNEKADLNQDVKVGIKFDLALQKSIFDKVSKIVLLSKNSDNDFTEINTDNFKMRNVDMYKLVKNINYTDKESVNIIDIIQSKKDVYNVYSVYIAGWGYVKNEFDYNNYKLIINLKNKESAVLDMGSVRRPDVVSTLNIECTEDLGYELELFIKEKYFNNIKSIYVVASKNDEDTLVKLCELNVKNDTLKVKNKLTNDDRIKVLLSKIINKLKR